MMMGPYASCQVQPRSAIKAIRKHVYRYQTYIVHFDWFYGTCTLDNKTKQALTNCSIQVVGRVPN